MTLRRIFTVMITATCCLLLSGCVTRLVAREARGYPSPKFDDISHIAGAWQSDDDRWMALLLEGEFQRPERLRRRYTPRSGPLNQALWLIDRNRLAKAGANIIAREYLTELEGEPPFAIPGSGLRRGLKQFKTEWETKGDLAQLEVPKIVDTQWRSLPVIDLRGIDNVHARGNELRRLAVSNSRAIFLMASAEEYAGRGDFFVVFTERNLGARSVSQYRLELDPGQREPRPIWWLATPFAVVWDVVVVFPYMLLMGLLGGGSTSIAIIA